MFVHGGVEDTRAWTPQLDALSDDFTVIAWDEPGAGGSTDVPDEFSLSDYADCLAGMVRALVGSPTSVVGISWGTTVILDVYRRHPAVVRSMALADGYAGWRGSLGAEEADARLAAMRAALAEPDGAFDPTLPGLFAGEPPALFVRLMETIAADVRPHTMLTTLTAMAQADLAEVLPTVQVPDTANLGCARRPIATVGGTRLRAPNPWSEPGGDPRLRTRQQPRGTGTVQ